MENIKNTSEDNGKIIIRISNKMAFSYVFEQDAFGIDNDIVPNNYRYATREETNIYNNNKQDDERFYSLYNAPELRHETLKERVSAILENKKLLTPDMVYRTITADLSRKYWEHELNSSKDKEIEALKKQVSSLIEYKDELTKNLLNTNNWIDVSVEPEFGDEYNVVYDLQDGGIPLTTTMEYDKVEKVWKDVIGSGGICNTVISWQPLPKPELIICKEKNCTNPATTDYNSHKHWVCDKHYKSLTKFFEEEYD